MKIAILTDSFYPDFNGLVSSLIQTTKALAEKGHHILIITAKYPENNEIFIHKNIEIVRLSSIPLFTYKGIRIIMPNKKKVMKELKLFHPDIIHVHQLGVTTPYALRYARFHTIPIIATFHSLCTEQIEYIMPHRLLGIHHLFEKKNDINKNNLTRYQTTKSFVWKILKKYYSRFNLIITPSTAIKNELIEKEINKNIEVISNGINLNKFPVKTDYSQKNKILHFGRISYERNVDILVKAFDNFLKRNNQNREDIELHIIGNGPEFEKVKRLIKELNREDSIKIFGYLPRETIINDFLTNYDFAITASTMETQSMMILESFAAGLPVIGVDKYAIPDLVRHESTGFIARAFDIEELAYYMEKMYESQQLREMLGVNAKKEAEKHELSIIISQLEALYKRIIEEKRIIVEDKL